MEKELIFVYNADSGFWNETIDMMHKVLSPDTCSCNLCAITYGPFSMKKEWKSFIQKLPLEVSFLHRDEWLKLYPSDKSPLPSVFLKDKDTVSEWISAAELSSFNLKQLMVCIENRAEKIK